jgi:hypothetical protein
VLHALPISPSLTWSFYLYLEKSTSYNYTATKYGDSKFGLGITKHGYSVWQSCLSLAAIFQWHWAGITSYSWIS